MLSKGIRQYVDLGTGLPSETYPAFLGVVREHSPYAAVIYVDDDQVALAHLRALSVPSDDDRVTVIDGDLTDPSAVVAACQDTGLIEWDKPACVILILILHFYHAEKAQQIASAYIAALAPGSYVILTVACAAQRIGQQLSTAYEAAHVYNHTPSQVAGFFSGLDLVGPGIVEARAWDPDQSPPSASVPSEVQLLAGVGRKP